MSRGISDSKYPYKLNGKLNGPKLLKEKLRPSTFDAVHASEDFKKYLGGYGYA